MVTYTTRSANLMLRALGLSLYLACLGLDAGAHFFDTVFRPEGLLWIATGFALTVVPVLIMGILQVAEDRFRNNGGYAVRKHGKPHGAELRQRHHSGRQSVCSLCYGLSAVHVSTGNYSPSAAHVLH
jgi:hypothetical protein